MNEGVITSSLLKEKAAKRNIRNIANAAYDIQVAVYRETLVDLEKYLDVGDLRKLNSSSLGIIRDDILEIINGIRDMRSKIVPGAIKSLDGTLEKLRGSRNSLQVAMGMFTLSGELNESKSRKFFEQMDAARKRLEEALGLFRPY